MTRRKIWIMIGLLSLFCMTLANMVACERTSHKETSYKSAKQKENRMKRTSITISDRDPLILQFAPPPTSIRNQREVLTDVVVIGVCTAIHKLYPIISPSISVPGDVDIEAVIRITGMQHPPGNPNATLIYLRYFFFNYKSVWQGSYLIQKGQMVYFLFDGNGKCLKIWIPPSDDARNPRAESSFQ